MKKQLILLGFIGLIISIPALAQEDIFPLGEKAPNVHHTGDVWLNHVSAADETFDFNMTHVVMAPGAKLNWHLHPAGQQLLITKGVGYYQEKGKEAQVVRTGDLIKCEPNVEHWHAASPDSEVAYLAISGNKPTQWTDELTQEAYDAIEAPEVENVEQQIKDLSKQKWDWMAEKNVGELAPLFHDESKLVHMSGSWKKDRELEIIESGSIWYKKTVVHDTDAEVVGKTAVVWSRITLEAHVRGNDVSNEFTTTEVYLKQGKDWKLLALTFSSVRDTHEIEH